VVDERFRRDTADVDASPAVPPGRLFDHGDPRAEAPQVRCERLAALAEPDDHSVTRVAREVGYRSESAFEQAFRAMLGMSPAQYRKDASSSG
jgi:methylphosphotriester-DNA--protein-cysteine methyltransferase